MDLAIFIHEVQAAADAFASGDREGHPRLLKAIRKLNHAAETPTETLMRISYQPVQNATIRIAVEMGLPQAIVNKKEGITTTELSKESGASKELIVRVMRVLVALDLCIELSGEKYLANSVTEVLASPSFNGGTRYMYDVFIPTAAKFVDFMRDTGFQDPQDQSPFEYTHQQGFWEYLKARPQLQKDMMDYMTGRRADGIRWPDVFPIASQVESNIGDKKDAVLLVDIGGNQGHDLKLFKEKHPNLLGRVILMDLPQVVSNITDPLEGIEVIPYDMFTPQPIRGAKFYFFRAICHDWPDKVCQKFLGNAVNAMEKGYSKLLINDLVLPETGTDLLPSLLDIMMMSSASGLERTEKQWRTLLDSVGLEIVKIWAFGGTEAVIETQLKA